METHQAIYKEERQGKTRYITPEYWKCNCAGDYLCIDGLDQCEQCGALQSECESADLATFLKHSRNLVPNRVQAVINTMISAKEFGLDLADMLLYVGHQNGYILRGPCDTDTSIIIKITIDDMAYALANKIQKGLLDPNDLASRGFDKCIEYIKKDLDLLVADAVDCCINNWIAISENTDLN
ncbi:MAG: hypothetical protein RBT34_00250 [Anaerolineaceae bacterium]|nr:hypothetical protein [Anaerolineaceae bacterium]